MALGRDSDLFSGGVDIHGVHDRTLYGYLNSINYEKAPDYDLARETAWKSSPIADIDTWKSPVLIIHADDDRNVYFKQSTDLVQRLRKKKVYMETMVIVDENSIDPPLILLCPLFETASERTGLISWFSSSLDLFIIRYILVFLSI